jgi:hypothetical protein
MSVSSNAKFTGRESPRLLPSCLHRTLNNHVEKVGVFSHRTDRAKVASGGLFARRGGELGVQLTAKRRELLLRKSGEAGEKMVEFTLRHAAIL